MEKLCKIRDLQHGIMVFEQQFVQRYGICLNEGMVLCSLMQSETGTLTSGELSSLLGLSHSNTSKVVASAEKKGLVSRCLGDHDKRKMLFSLSSKGTELIQSIHCDNIPLPDVLRDKIH